MGWELIAIRLPEEIRTLKDLQQYDDFVPEPIGARNEIINKIIEIAPDADFSNPASGRIPGSTFHIEVIIGDQEIVESFTFRVSGGDEPLYLIVEILKHLGIRAIIPGDEDGILDPHDPDKFSNK